MKQLTLFKPGARRRRRADQRRPGPKPSAERAGFMPHRTRPVHRREHPVHVTIRRTRLAPSFRSERVFRVIAAELRRAKRKGVRVVQHSVQHDHLHLMIEGEDSANLSTQMRNLFSRIAMMINACLGRRGSVFADRHHRRALATPTETRNALIYILFNGRKHEAQRGWLMPEELGWLDEKSSAPWFEGWHPEARPPPDLVARCRRADPSDPSASTTSSEPTIIAPETWLARTGWRRGGGPVRFDALPLRHRPR